MPKECTCDDPWRENHKAMEMEHEILENRLSKHDTAIANKLPIWVFVSFFTIFASVIGAFMMDVNHTANETLKMVMEIKTDQLVVKQDMKLLNERIRNVTINDKKN